LAVPDYVSEKAFEALFAGTVPVYRGTSSIRKFMPADDAFIDANDMTAPALAALLHRLAGTAPTGQVRCYPQYGTAGAPHLTHQPHLLLPWYR
jgi:Glycosyltransferase family 10 (fucosyltransferase) C-term